MKVTEKTRKVIKRTFNLRTVMEYNVKRLHVRKTCPHFSRTDCSEDDIPGEISDVWRKVKEGFQFHCNTLRFCTDDVMEATKVTMCFKWRLECPCTNHWKFSGVWRKAFSQQVGVHGQGHTRQEVDGWPIALEWMKKKEGDDASWHV